MVTKTTHEERVTGQSATLKFSDPNAGGTYELPFENVSWSRDIGTTSTQHNGSLKEVKATTSITFSGSFEYSGRNYDALNALVYGSTANPTGSAEIESHRPVRGTLSVTEEVRGPDGETTTYTYTFKNVQVTSTSRDLPATDFASTSIDWEAEDMIITKDGAKPGSSYGY
ncbi:hypothetical protein [Halosegnis longus]|uniref:hypothetical protein n=1 Tax=Halosegnis longus TaxID=2216012 RepID=UPI00129D36AE|nr:hypothetical protein [Halosegnis longus]